MRKSHILGRLSRWWNGSDVNTAAVRPRRFSSLRFEPLEQRSLLTALSIAQENALPGASPDEWDIDGSGSANIQGYAAQFSVDQGQRVDFKIDTDADDYRIDIYRMGYYGGLGARHITTIDPNAALANNQPNPVTNFQTGLVDAGNWRVSASWDVPDDATSGVYIAKLSREDGTFGESHIIFVVRDDDGHSDMVLQTSDTTWVAYNDYGGSSLYGNGFLPYGRAYEVSYNRPLTTRDRATSTFFFGAEYPMVRFLEANGYDVSYISGIDTDRAGAELLEHKIFISVGHDEYWSGQQRANVEAARDAGVNLAFFGGNDVFWKHRWEDSIDGSNTPYTTLVSYKETHDNAKTDPLADVWTGTWRDPRFSPPADGGRPENALTGTIFTVNGDSIIGRPMIVDAASAKMRFWRNTNVANLTGNQTASLGDHVLGYEWNEDLDNGFRPAGLMRLSNSTYNVSAYIQDYGSTYKAGTATHALTMYRAASGAIVFSAGTIQYSWGLDGFHDGPNSSTSRDMQQATVNLFADMGVQPTSLMDNLMAAVMSTDFVAPFSTITSPTEGVTVSAGVAITIRGTATEQGGGRVAGVEVSVDNGATWHPATGRDSWTYTWTPRSSGMVTIRSRAVDDSGNIETPSDGIVINPSQNPGVYSFWDTGATPAQADSGDTQAVELGVRFRVDTDGFITGVRFYKASGNTGTHVAHLWSNSGQLLATATFTSETNSGWQQVNFSTPVAVTAGSTYVASYSAPNGRYSISRGYFTSLGVDNGPLHALGQSAAGANGVYVYSPGNFPTQSYQATNYWVDVVFNTALAQDATAPTVTKFGQADNGPVVYTNSSFTVTFSEAINPNTINTANVVFVKPDNSMLPVGCCPTPGGWCSGCPLLNAVNNTVINTNIVYDTATRTATITPTSALDPSTVYTIIVNAGGVKDLAGNALAIDTWSSVYTSNQPAPVISNFFSPSTTPTTVDSGDTQSVELGMKFTADTDGLITGARFYKGAGNTGTHTATLWSSSGQALATATFTNETASGWQQVSFSSPVAITASQTYTISYHANNGRYSVTRNYFNSARESGPLNTPVNAGVYGYGASSLFPTQTYQGSNYLVDVVFSNSTPGDTVAPTVVNFNPFDNAGGVSTNPSIKIYFSEVLDTSTVTSARIKLLDNWNNAVPTTLSYDPNTRTATLTPTSPLGSGSTYTIFVLGGSAGIRDLAGNTMALNTTSAFTTIDDGVVDTTAPTITGFGPANGATQISVTPTLTVTFSEPMNAASIKSNTVYLLKNGATLVTTTLSYDAATRTATLVPTAPLSNSSSYTIYVLGGSSGVKDLAGNALATHTQSVFSTQAAPTDTTAPTVTGFTPIGGSSNVGINTTATVTFSEAMNASTISSSTVFLRDSSNVVVAATVSYNASNNRVTIIPNANLSNSKTYTIVVKGGASGVKDVAGNALAADVTSSFTTIALADTTAPTVTGFTPAAGANNVAINTAATIVFSEAMNAATITAANVFLRDSSNVVVAATVSYNASNNTATITPSASLGNSKTYTIVVKSGASGVKDVAGNALAADATSTFNTVAAPPPAPPVDTVSSSVWSNSATPSIIDSGDKSGVELGMKFISDSNGTISGIRFYKSSANTGTHTGSLWSASGQLLATGTFTNETSSGWQTLTFATPVSITAGTTYIASYHTNSGRYSVNRNYFSSQYTSGLIRVLANGGVYAYGNSTAPTNTYQASNYWVDVVLNTPAPTDTTAPTVTAFSPTNGAGNVSTGTTATVTFSEAMDAATITNSTVFLRNASGATVAANVSYNASNRTATITPTAALANSANYTIVVKSGTSGVKDVAGNALASDATAAFTTAAVADTTRPTVTGFSPSNGASNVSIGTTATVTFSEAMNASSITNSTVFLRNASGATVAATVSYNASNNTATITPTASLANSATYTIVVKSGTSGVKDLAGNALLSDATASFTTLAAVDTTRPTVTGFSPANNATGVAIGSTATVTFSEAMDASTITNSTVFLRNASGATVAANVSYNASNRTATITPTASLANSATYTIVVKSGTSGVKDVAGNALLSDATASFTTAAAVAPSSRLFNASATPSIVDSGDKSSVELGVKFSSDVAGYITGIRFYKSSQNKGTHTGNLWTADGQLLATGTFSNESNSGWQTLTFSSPVAITAGTTYVASYHTITGRYSVDRNYFSSAYTNGTLRVPANGGVYLYGAGGFPTNTYQASNYWVDVVFSAT